MATVAFGGFYDISVRGVGCPGIRSLVADLHETWDGKTLSGVIRGYRCGVLYADDVNVTARCADSSGAILRVTFQRDAEQASHPIDIHECGTYSRFYDISVRRVSCRRGAALISDDASRWTGLQSATSGFPPNIYDIAGFGCEVIYNDDGHKTIRCTAGKAAVRFSIADVESTLHPRRPPASIEEAVVVNPRTGYSGQGMSIRVMTACGRHGSWDAITALGVSCDTVYAVLGGNDLTRIAKDVSSSAGPFDCRRISAGKGQATTIRCRAPGGARFRASLLR